MRKSTLFSAALSLLLGSVSAYGQSAGDVVYVPGERVATLAERTKYFMYNTFEKSEGVAYGFLKGTKSGEGACSFVQQDIEATAVPEGNALLWTIEFHQTTPGQTGFRNAYSKNLIGGSYLAAHNSKKDWNYAGVTSANVSSLTAGKYLASDNTWKPTSEAAGDKVFLLGKFFKVQSNGLLGESSSGHPFAFYTAVEKTYIGVTYIYSGGDAAVKNYSVVQLEGSAAYAPEVIGYRNIYDKETINKVDANGSSQLTINVTLQRDYDSYVRAINRWLAVPQGAVGSSIYAQQNAETIQDQIAAYEANKEDADKQAVIKTLYETIIAGPFVEFAYGKYYRFYSAEPSLFARNIGMGFYQSNKIGWSEVNENDANAIFFVQNNKHLYYPNSQKHIMGPGGLIGDEVNIRNEFQVVSLGYVAQQAVAYGNVAGNSMTINGTTTNASGEVGGSSSPAPNSTGAWYVVPVSEIELNLNAVGSDYYGTAYFPFPVSGKDLYTGSINAEETELTMASVSGAVPAKTGLVVKSKDSKVVLTIESAGTAPESNSLTGTLFSKANANAADCVVLGQNEGNIGFYRLAQDVNIPANKAYLQLTAQGAVRMQFDGETTDIEGVNLADGEVKGNAPIFDLTGRRVQKTVKGGLYIQGGQKFIAR